METKLSEMVESEKTMTKHMTEMKTDVTEIRTSITG
jgi:hypothetical protein